jgi:Tol biopolymer transport system component
VKRNGTTERALGAAAAALVLGATMGTAAGITKLERISVSSDGAPANSHCFFPAISGDGRYIAFETFADNLVPGDTNSKEDILVRDRVMGTTEVVSVSTSGQAADDYSSDPKISADGRYVVFESHARNLIPGEANARLAPQIYLRDRTMGTTERISVSSTGEAGNRESSSPSISADGRFVAFESEADNLVPGDTNGSMDVFVRDRSAGTTERVNLSPTGAQVKGTSQIAAGRSPSISSDGRYVAFSSVSDSLVPGDTNDSADVFVRDRTAGTTERISVSPSGEEGNGWSYSPGISGDGHCVAFTTEATNLAPGQVPYDPCSCHSEVLVRDRIAGTTERVVLSWFGDEDYDGDFPSISADGRFVAFYSMNPLVPIDLNDTADIFVRDRLKGITQRISVSADGKGADKQSLWPAISADGRCVVFSSKATNLTPGATNDQWQLYVSERSVD